MEDFSSFESAADFTGQFMNSAFGGLASSNPQAILGFILGSLGVFAVLLTILVFIFVVSWKLFKKMGNNGYEALINGHNVYVFITKAGKPGWYFFLLLVPYLAGLIVMSLGGLVGSELFSGLGGLIMVGGYIYLGIDLNMAMAKRFNKSTGFAMGMTFLGIIFYPILALGKSVYTPVGKK